MRKALKLALDREQIECKNKYNEIDAFEIHLFGDERDDFSLYPLIEKPLTTIHYALYRSDILDIANEYESEYTQKVFELAEKADVGIVVHAESRAFNIYNKPEVEAFCKYIKERGIKLHVENCYRNIGAVEALEIMHYMRDRIDDKHVFPLLDTCHLMMSEMSFKYDELSIPKAIDAYKSKCFKMHLNDCIGSGEKETGGIHGTNFSHNLYLLNNILWKLYNLEKEGYHPDLILEIDEKDYIRMPEAIELAHNIDMFWNSYIEQEELENSLH